MLHARTLRRFVVRMRGERLARESALARHDASALLAASDVDTECALEQLGSSGNGLLPHQVSERLSEYGPNQIAHEQPARWYGLLLHTIPSSSCWASSGQFLSGPATGARRLSFR